jgi:O-antigen/teichoic acid export membrane protein
MRAAKNFIILFIGDGLNYLLNFFATVYLARVLEVSNFGKISFAFAFFSFGSFLTNLGLVSIGTRDIAQSLKTSERSWQNKYISNVITLRQVLAAIIFIVLMVIALVINKPYEVKLLIMLYGLSLFPFALLLEWVFLGWEKMLYITISKLILGISYFALVFAFIKNPEQIKAVPVIFLVSNLLCALFLVFVYLRRRLAGHVQSKFRARFSEWQMLLKSALPIGVGALLIQFSLNFNVVFLGLVKNSLSVGLFSASSKILFFILIFDRVMNNTTFPIISRYYLDGKEKLSLVLSRLNKLILAIAIPISAGGFILARPLIVFIYGADYEPSSVILRILIWFFFITMLNSLFTSSLIAGKKNKDYVTSIGLGVLANVVLNIILVPMLGGRGTAISLISAELVTLLLLIQKTRPIAQIKIKLSYIIKPITAALVMISGILILQSRLTLIPLIIISIIIYSLVMLFIRGIAKKDFTLGQI